jgi:hypothetical protein
MIGGGSSGTVGRPLLVLACVLALAAAGGCSSGGSSATSTPSPAPDGYLYASQSEAIFVKWTASTGATTGSVDWRTAPAQRITADFAVEPTSGGFSFRFEPGFLAGWTGTLDGTSLSLVIPSATGGLRTVPLRAASTAEFEQAVAAFE